MSRLIHARPLQVAPSRSLSVRPRAALDRCQRAGDFDEATQRSTSGRNRTRELVGVRGREPRRLRRRERHAEDPDCEGECQQPEEVAPGHQRPSLAALEWQRKGRHRRVPRSEGLRQALFRAQWTQGDNTKPSSPSETLRNALREARPLTAIAGTRSHARPEPFRVTITGAPNCCLHAERHSGPDRSPLHDESGAGPRWTKSRTYLWTAKPVVPIRRALRVYSVLSLVAWPVRPWRSRGVIWMVSLPGGAPV